MCGNVGVDIGVDDREVGAFHCNVFPDSSIAVALSLILATDQLQLIPLVVMIVELILVCGGSHAVSC